MQQGVDEPIHGESSEMQYEMAVRSRDDDAMLPTSSLSGTFAHVPSEIRIESKPPVDNGFLPFLAIIGHSIALPSFPRGCLRQSSSDQRPGGHSRKTRATGDFLARQATEGPKHRARNRVFEDPTSIIALAIEIMENRLERSVTPANVHNGSDCPR